jgi:hypothetical protein
MENLIYDQQQEDELLQILEIILDDSYIMGLLQLI